MQNVNIVKSVKIANTMKTSEQNSDGQNINRFWDIWGEGTHIPSCYVFKIEKSKNFENVWKAKGP